MLFIDASVIVAIIGQEDDAEHLMDRLSDDDGPFYVSALVRMEATLALTRQMAEAHGRNKPATPEIVGKARPLVDQFIADLEAREAMISGDVGTNALDAAQLYGKIVTTRQSSISATALPTPAPRPIGPRSLIRVTISPRRISAGRRYRAGTRNALCGGSRSHLPLTRRYAKAPAAALDPPMTCREFPKSRFAALC